jgi:hypothetical protein
MTNIKRQDRKNLVKLHGVEFATESANHIIQRCEDLKPIRTQEFYSLPENQQKALDEISSAYTEAIIQNELIELSVKKTIKQTEDSVVELMSAMDVAMETKMKAIHEFRTWRKTVESEVSSLRLAMKQIDEVFPRHRIDELKELGGLLKALNDLKPNDVVKKLIG